MWELLWTIPFAACIAACDVPTAHSPDHQPRATRSLPRPGETEHPGLDGVFYALDEEAPGFAGLTKDDDGGWVLHSTHPAPSAAMVDAVARRVPEVAQGRARLRTRTARFSFGQLYRWRLRLEQQLPPSTVFTDVDEAQNKVVIGVEHEADRAALRARGEGLGLPPQAYDVVLAAPIKPAATLRTRNRPIYGGAQIFWKAIRTGSNQLVQNGCSMGFPARLYYDPNWTGFLTASHCGPRMFGIDDFENLGIAYYYQGGRTEQDKVGLEQEDPTAFTSSDDYHCPSGKACRWSDAMWVQYAFDPAGGQYAERAVSWPVLPAAVFPRDETQIYDTPFTGHRSSDLYTGDVLYKIGAQTGYTYGSVNSTCINFFTNYTDLSDMISKEYTILCGVRSNILLDNGDSGGTVFRLMSVQSGSFNPVFAEGIVSGSNASGTYASSCYGIRRDFPTMDSPCHS